MKPYKVVQVGNVKVEYLTKAPDNSYSESEAAETDTEKYLLELFKSPDAERQKTKLLARELPWPLRYHLSPQRGNIISWYNFSLGASVLEVGAGPGAITEELVKKDVRVTSLELTERRSLINAYRNKDRTNLKVVIGNLQEFKPRQKFDYVVCVGVMEYAGSFIDGKGDMPYINFLKMLKSNLKPGGKLILAIENRFGLKYLSGTAEDHTGNLFDGLNAYPANKKVQTFSRLELDSLIAESGFSERTFYYPYPDYKMPLAIYSDAYLPGRETDFPLGFLPTPSPGAASQPIFSEQAAMISVQRSHLYGELANSFLVEAG